MIDQILKSGRDVVSFNEIEKGEMLGGGGFGEVFSVFYRGKQAAIKIINPSNFGYNIDKAREEFLNEIS